MIEWPVGPGQRPLPRSWLPRGPRRPGHDRRHDRSYPLAEIVEAHRYVDSGHKVGNVAITLVDD